MRCFVRSIERGFTLLELSLALAVAGVLVATLVSLWSQVTRTLTMTENESIQDRRERRIHQEFRRFLDGLQWTAQSLQPQGTQAWTSGSQFIQVWSRSGAGVLPGPARWRLEATHEGLRAHVNDPRPGGGEVEMIWPEFSDFRLDLLQESPNPVDRGSTRWIALADWSPMVPFKPIGFRLNIKRQDGTLYQIQSLP